MRIKKEYEKQGCTLLSLENEYVNNRSELTFIAKCGHIYKSSYISFKKSSKNHMCKECSNLLTSGENNYNWKGGTYTSEVESFRKTYEFKFWQKSVLKRDNYTCQCCNKKYKNPNAHHLDGYNWCIEKRTDIDNGITLCKECHTKFHVKYGYGDNTREQFEEFIIKIKNK